MARILDDDSHPVPAVVIGKVAYHSHAGLIRDIRVGVAFNVLNVVSGPASDVFSRDASVFVSSRVSHYVRALSSLAFEPI